ncbi:MAG: response regulator transcription factor [Caldilineales bacterium]|nr:response regulator transcription factor [Caldilineales bacterium]MDW8319333.1 response regulator transcription factor [Anaerolineae bacterium]
MLKVLLVDPNPYFIRSLRSILSGLPELTVVGEACSLAEGRVKAQTLQPDLVLVDARTPGLADGHRIRHLKQWLPAGKIIVLTVFDAAPYRAALVADGADECLSKETLAEDLLPTIVRLFPQEVSNG